MRSFVIDHNRGSLLRDRKVRMLEGGILLSSHCLHGNLKTHCAPGVGRDLVMTDLVTHLFTCTLIPYFPRFLDLIFDEPRLYTECPKYFSPTTFSIYLVDSPSKLSSLLRSLQPLTLGNLNPRTPLRSCP